MNKQTMVYSDDGILETKRNELPNDQKTLMKLKQVMSTERSQSGRHSYSISNMIQRKYRGPA